MLSNWTRCLAGLLLVVAAVEARAQTALPAEVARYGYADLVVFNGKIVSMDDAGRNSNPGSTYQAMAVKGDRIIALGPNDRIRALADAHTKVIDLAGQTVIPGIVETHVHLYGTPQLAGQLGLKAPDKGVSVRVSAGKDVESTRLRIENAIRENAAKLNPGDWVVVRVTPNAEDGISQIRVQSWFAAENIEPRTRLDGVAPANPVLVEGGIRGNLNSQALEMANRLIPNYSKFIQEAVESDAPETGEVGSAEMGNLTWGIWYRNQPVSLIAEMFRRELEMAAAHGITTFSSRINDPVILDGYTLLDREGQMPIRFGALLETHRRAADPAMTRQLYRMMGNLTGLGDDYLWIHGVASERWDTSFPMSCLGPDVPAPPRIKARELCPKPGSLWWDTLQNALESGWRLAGVHGIGSNGVRLFLQMVTAAMKDRNLSPEDIRKLRLTIEHADVLGKVPDVVAGLKNYGVIVSVNPWRLLREPDFLKDYGPAIDPFMLPVKSLLDQGVKVVGQCESYRGQGYLWTILMTRNVYGKQVGPEEAVDRVTVMKMWTRWAAEYVLRENRLGSLETGKLADFLVMDRDYFTVPIEEIPKIRPQMTVVGGQIRFLNQDFAQKLGMPAVGYQFPAGYEPWGVFNPNMNAEM